MKFRRCVCDKVRELDSDNRSGLVSILVTVFVIVTAILQVVSN
jgi:hypothetical protein